MACLPIQSNTTLTTQHHRQRGPYCLLLRVFSRPRSTSNPYSSSPFPPSPSPSPSPSSSSFPLLEGLLARAKGSWSHIACFIAARTCHGDGRQATLHTDNQPSAIKPLFPSLIEWVRIGLGELTKAPPRHVRARGRRGRRRRSGRRGRSSRGTCFCFCFWFLSLSLGVVWVCLRSCFWRGE